MGQQFWQKSQYLCILLPGVLLVRSLSLMQPTSNLFYCSCISVLHSHEIDCT